MERRPPSSRVVSLLVAVVVVVVLYFAKPVLLPLAVAVLLSVVIAPAVRVLERAGTGRFRLGRVGSVAAVALASAIVFAGMGWTIAVQGGALAERLPEYRRIVRDRLREPLDSLHRLERTAREVRELAEPSGAQPKPSKVEVVEGGSELVAFARAWAGSLVSLLGTAGLVIVLLVFLLIEREPLRDRLLRVAAPRDLRTTISALRDAVERVTRYVRALALLNLGHGVVIALGLWAFGLPGALLLGLLSALLRFVPYLGPWLSATLTLLAALASADGWMLPLAVACFLIGVELVSNNVLEPWLFGASIGVSPFGLILCTIFWAWLWGPIGLVLATPLTACLVAFGRYAPSLEPLAILLGDAEALSPAERLYQRFVAHDVYEARALVAECAQELGPVAVWDEVVLPALRLFERDRQEGRLGSEQLEIALDTFDLLVGDLPEPAPDAASASKPAVLCIPAQRCDEVVCAALARLLAAAGVPARALGHKLSAESAEETAQTGAKAVCISSLMGSSGAAQHLRLRIGRRCPELGVVLGLWGREAIESGGGNGSTHTVARFADAMERLRPAAS